MAGQSPYTGDTRRIDGETDTLPLTAPFDRPRYEPQPQRQPPGTLRVQPWQVALLVLVALLPAFASLGNSVRFGWGAEQTIISTKQQFDAHKLALDINAGNVTLAGSDDDQIIVAIEQHGFGWAPEVAEHVAERVRPTITQDGDTLRIATPHDWDFGWE